MAKKNTVRWDIDRWEIPAGESGLPDCSETNFDAWFQETASAGEPGDGVRSEESHVVESWDYTTRDGKLRSFHFPRGDSPSLFDIENFAFNVLLAVDSQITHSADCESVVLESAFSGFSTTLNLPPRPVVIAALELWHHCDKMLCQQEKEDADEINDAPTFLTGRLLERVRILGGFERYVEAGKSFWRSGDRNEPEEMPARDEVFDALLRARRRYPHMGIKDIKKRAASAMGIGFNRFSKCIKDYKIENNEWDKI